MSPALTELRDSTASNTTPLTRFSWFSDTVLAQQARRDAREKTGRTLGAGLTPPRLPDKTRREIRLRRPPTAKGVCSRTVGFREAVRPARVDASRAPREWQLNHSRDTD